MQKEKKPPKRLYKYRSFDKRVFRMLVDDFIYFSDPSLFNDPLDSKPTVKVDMEIDGLETLYRKLAAERRRVEKTAAAESIEYRGAKTIERIQRMVSDEINYDLEALYHAAEFDLPDNPSAENALKYSINDELLRRYEKGVFSLAERATCPLMWSHYGDQHRGLCLGYAVPEEAEKNLYKVSYSGSRLIKTS